MLMGGNHIAYSGQGITFPIHRARMALTHHPYGKRSQPTYMKDCNNRLETTSLSNGVAEDGSLRLELVNYLKSFIFMQRSGDLSSIIGYPKNSLFGSLKLYILVSCLDSLHPPMSLPLEHVYSFIRRILHLLKPFFHPISIHLTHSLHFGAPSKLVSNKTIAHKQSNP